MGKVDRDKRPAKKAAKKAKKSAKKPQPPPSDDDYEDGDIATPKLDRDGQDDEPL
jgi:hypothetical protein